MTASDTQRLRAARISLGRDPRAWTREALEARAQELSDEDVEQILAARALEDQTRRDSDRRARTAESMRHEGRKARGGRA